MDTARSSSTRLVTGFAAALALALATGQHAPAAPGPSAAQFSTPAVSRPLADVPDCSDLRDYVSEADLRRLRGMGFSDRTVGAVVLIAHHSRQPLDRVAGRVRSGESPRSVAAGLGLDGGALLATADALIPGLPPAAGDGIVRPPISPVRERVAGVRLEQRRRESRRRARGSIR